MEQYQDTGRANPKPKASTGPDAYTAILESQLAMLRSTVELQSRQIRRLETSVQILESQLNSRLR